MKTLTGLLVAGALTLGVAMAQDAPKTANPAPAAPAKANSKVKKHRTHHKKAVAKTATPATNNLAPKK